MFDVSDRKECFRKKARPVTINHLRLTRKAQVILEFTFCMIIVLLMLFGITKVFLWTGRDFVGRSAAHDETLYGDFDPDVPHVCVAIERDEMCQKPLLEGSFWDDNDIVTRRFKCPHDA